MSKIFGSANDDTLIGFSDSNNFLYGYGGDDRIYLVGDGRDLAYGGPGNDTFVFIDNGYAPVRTDYIKDFEDGADKIELSTYGLTAEDIAITEIRGGSLMQVSTDYGTFDVVVLGTGFDLSDIIF